MKQLTNWFHQKKSQEILTFDFTKFAGALWHIFQPEDTIKIRDFLNKIAIEKGLRLDPHDDPIHDQSTYLDMHLRTRLYNEYGVKGKKKLE